MMWTEKQLQQLKKEGRIKSFTKDRRKIIPQKSGHNIPKIEKRSKEKEWLSWNLLYWANEHALELVTEHPFDEKRKWRFDWAFPAIKCAVEYEGIFSGKSRHTTISGYTGDTEKYNRAQALGWRIIRLTAINYKSVLTQLNNYLKS